MILGVLAWNHVPDSRKAGEKVDILYLQACVGSGSPFTVAREASNLHQCRCRFSGRHGEPAAVSEQAPWAYLMHLMKTTHAPVSFRGVQAW